MSIFYIKTVKKMINNILFLILFKSKLNKKGCFSPFFILFLFLLVVHLFILLRLQQFANLLHEIKTIKIRKFFIDNI